MLPNLWHRYSFIGSDSLNSDDSKIRLVITNRLGLLLCVMSLGLFSLYALYDYEMSILAFFIIPLVMAISVPILNHTNNHFAASIIMSLLVPLSLLILSVVQKIKSPPHLLLEEEYYRNYLWLILSTLIPVLVIDSKRKLVMGILLVIPFTIIFLLDPIEYWFGVGMNDVGLDGSRVILFQIVTAMVSLVVVSSLLFMQSVSRYYQSRMARMQNQLLESEKMTSVGVLTSGISHEINNPLNFITGGNNVLKLLSKEGFIDESIVKEPIELIDNGVNRIDRIVKSLQYFTQGSSGRECINVADIITDCLKFIGDKYDQGLLVIPKMADRDLRIEGDRSQLYHALLNVINNAISAVHPESGRIEVVTDEFEEFVHIDVVDNGPGIAAKHLSRVIEPFYTTKDPGEGIGMGLSITYNIVNYHGGKLEIASEESVGTKVTMYFPKSKEKVPVE